MCHRQRSNPAHTGDLFIEKKNMSDGFIFGLHRMVVLAASCCVCIELMFLFQSISGHFIHSEGTKHIRVSYVAQLVKSLGGKFQILGYFSKTALIRSCEQERTLKCVITLAFPLSLNLHLPLFFSPYQSTLAIFIHLQRSMLVCQCFHVLMRCVSVCGLCVC